MTRHHHLPAAAIALAVCVAACAPTPPSSSREPAPEAAPPPPATPEAPPPPTPEQVQAGAAQLEELERMLALDTRCNWLEPAARVALEATAGERRAWLVWHEGQQASPKPAKVSCDNAEIRDAVRYGTWQMRVTWALRAHALLGGDTRPAWIQNLSSVGAHRDALQTASDGLEKRHTASIQQARPGIQQEAELMLATRCSAHKAAGPCPSVPGDAAFAAYAETWLTQAEAYAVALSGVDDKVGAPPTAD